MTKICKLENCERKVRGQGYCLMHYLRWKRHGDPIAGRRFNGEDRKWLLENAINPLNDECVIWPFSRDLKGYPRLCGKWLAHRFVCEQVNGPPPEKSYHAAHTCGKGSSGCVSGRHLVWKTPTENESDKRVHGTLPHGENHWRTKLSEDQARFIRDCPRTFSNRILSEIFEISRASVSRIRTGEDWRYLDKPLTDRSH